MATTTPTPTTSRAWTYGPRGLPRDVLTLQANHPTPPFPPSNPVDQNEEWLLLRVAYAALNPGDVAVMAAVPALARSGPARTAAVPGYDVTAIVLDVWTPASSSSPSSSATTTTTTNTAGKTTPAGKATSRFNQGDEVVAFIIFDHIRTHGVGGLQEVVSIPAKYAVRLPEGKTLREGAGLLLTACTALRQFAESGVARGQRVLVNGASGGVGTAAAQVAREVVGPEGFVVGVCSGRNVEMVSGLGADEVVDYTQHTNLAAELTRRYGDRPFDAVLDAYGSQALFNYSAGFLKPDGIYDAAGIHADRLALWPVLKSGMLLLWNAVRPRSPWLGGTGRTWKAVAMMDPGMELMERAVALFAEGKLRVVVDSEWPFDRVLDAYDALLSGRARGKIVIKVAGDA